MVLPWFCRTSNDFEKMFLISNISMPSNLFKSENSASYGWFRKCHAINQHMSVLCLIMSWSSTSCWWFRCFKNTVFSESIRASTNSMVGSCVSGSPVPVEWRILRCRWLQVRVDWHFFGKLSILMYSPWFRTFQHILSQEMTDKYLSLRSISSCMFSLLQRGLKIHHCIRHCFMRRSSLKMTKLVGARCNMV